MRTATTTDHQSRVLRTLTYIHSHLDRPLTLDDLARQAAMSPFHFNRVFRTLLGEPPMQLLRRLRLERAVCALKAGDTTVTDAAFTAGYDAPEAFSRAFRAWSGLPPSALRSGNTALTVPAVASGVHFATPDRPPTWQTPTADGPEVVRTSRLDTPYVYARHVGPPKQLGRTFGRVMSWAGARGLLRGGREVFGLVYTDPDETPPQAWVYDVCIAGDGLEPGPDMYQDTLAGGTFARVMHRGRHRDRAKVYDHLLGRWPVEAGVDLAVGPVVETFEINWKALLFQSYSVAIQVRLAESEGPTVGERR